MRIGVMDSGIGGLTLLKRLVSEYPHNRYLYFSDNLYAPYGNRNIDFLEKRVTEVCDRMTLRGVELLVIGCNTAGSNLGEILRHRYDVPVVAMTPEAYPERERTLIMCTPLTARSEAVERYVKQGAEVYADPMLVPLIERNIFDLSPVYDYILPKLKSYAPKSITLGCTHYIYLKEGVERALGAECKDGTSRAAQEVGKALEGGLGDKPELEFIFSGDDESDKYIKLL